MWDVLFYRLNNLYLPAGCPQGMCQHTDYSGGDIEVFGPSGTTCCTDGKRIRGQYVHRLTIQIGDSLAGFRSYGGLNMGCISPKYSASPSGKIIGGCENVMVLQEYNAPHGVLCAPPGSEKLR